MTCDEGLLGRGSRVEVSEDDQATWLLIGEVTSIPEPDVEHIMKDATPTATAQVGVHFKKQIKTGMLQSSQLSISVLRDPQNPVQAKFYDWVKQCGEVWLRVTPSVPAGAPETAYLMQGHFKKRGHGIPIDDEQTLTIEFVPNSYEEVAV